MTATVFQVRRCADLYIATGEPVAASMVISICNQLEEAKESINALTLALEVERDAANLYAKQVAHWIEKHDALLDSQLATVPQEWSDENVLAWCVSRGIQAAQPTIKKSFTVAEQSAELDAGMAAQHYCRGLWGAARGHSDWRKVHEHFANGYKQGRYDESQAQGPVKL